MTPEEIAADRAVIDAATDGPWWIEQTPDRQSAVVAGAWVTLDWGDPDATFIAAARTGWPRALDALEAAQEGNDRLGAMVEWLAEVIVDARDACQRAESIEPSGSPEWVESGIAMRTTVLREVRAILDRERTAHQFGLSTRSAVAGNGEFAERAEKAEAAIARVRARHVKALGTDACEECSSWSLYRKVVPWPCATIRALDGEA